MYAGIVLAGQALTGDSAMVIGAPKVRVPVPPPELLVPPQAVSTAGRTRASIASSGNVVRHFRPLRAAEARVRA